MSDKAFYKRIAEVTKEYGPLGPTVVVDKEGQVSDLDRIEFAFRQFLRTKFAEDNEVNIAKMEIEDEGHVVRITIELKDLS